MNKAVAVTTPGHGVMTIKSNGCVGFIDVNLNTKGAITNMGPIRIQSIGKSV